MKKLLLISIGSIIICGATYAQPNATGAIPFNSYQGFGNHAIKSPMYPYVQQGSKLVGTGALPYSSQGDGVAISADGNTAIVGGYDDSYGAVWVYTRTAGIWTQQGPKLVGTGAIGGAIQGYAVSISADGNTIIVGGFGDNNYMGAAWVYTRTGGVWTQQGNKLIGTDSVGQSYQGYSVSLSADGNTAIVGGENDSSGMGAAWIFVRSGGVWTQQGPKLVGTGVIGSSPNQGFSVAISGDGNTAMVGGEGDGSGGGAAWMYTRTAGVWTQQGGKLHGSGASNSSEQGWSVSLSYDGNTAIIGGVNDDTARGAAWIFTRSLGVWTQQGNKLVGSGTAPWQEFGFSVSLSFSGDTAVIGGDSGMHNGGGGAWVFSRSGGIWSQYGNKLVGTGANGLAVQGASVAISADGSTIIVGGPNDSSANGAAWIFYLDITTGTDKIAENNNQLTVYPNPSNGEFTIRSIMEGVYTIINELGQAIQTFKLNSANQYTVNINNLSNGVYFIVGFNNNRHTEQKVVVSK